MKKLYTTLFFAILSFHLSAEILLEELFIGSTLPTGWTNTAISGVDLWTIRNAPAFGSTSGGYYAVFDDEALGAAATGNEAALTSPVVNCTNRTNTRLKFSHHWVGVENTHGYLEISNNGGGSWSTLQDYHKLTRGSIPAPQDTTFDISAFADNQASVQVRFRFVDGNVAGKYWYLDDIVIYCDPDVGIEQLTAPSYLACAGTYSTTEQVTVIIRNYSDDSVTNVPVQCDIIGLLTTTLNGTFTDTIPPRGSATFTFATTIDMSSNGVYHFFPHTLMPGDGYALNDTISDGRTQLVTGYPYLETFDTTNSGWQAGSNSPTKYWDLGQVPYLNGPQGNQDSWHLTNDNDGSRDAWVESPIFDLSALANPILSLDMKMNSLNDSYDRYVTIQYSTNNGASWTQLAPNNQPNFYGVSPQTTCCGWGNGTIDQWTTVYYGLCNLIGESCVRFRFFGNDLYETQFAFDNVQIFDRIDVGVTAFTEPVQDNCLYNDQEQVTITVTNFSCIPVYDIDVVCNVSGMATHTFTGTITDTILANGSYSFTFPGTIDMTPLGLYNLEAYTQMASDFNNVNDTLRQTINVDDVKIINYPYFENFDTDTAGWEGNSHNSTNVTKYWDWGVVPYLGGPQGNGNSFFLTDVNPGSIDAWVYSPIFDFSEVTHPDLEFDIMMNSLNDSYDRYVIVQYQLNESGTWTQLGVNTDPLFYGVSPQTTCCGWGNGNITPWMHVFLEDMCVVSGESCVRFRFFGNDLRETQFAFDNVKLTREGDDLEIVAITPTDAGDCGSFTNAEQVGLLIRNNTCRPLTNVPVRLTITGPSLNVTFNDTVAGPIMGEDELRYIFPSTIDMSVAGTYTFDAEIFDNPTGIGWSYINDTIPANNTHSEVRYNNIPINTFPYLADFNTTNDGWASWNTTSLNYQYRYFQWGTVPYLNGPEGEGTCWYLNDEDVGSRDCWVESPIFDFSAVTNPILSMDIKLHSLNDSYDRYVVMQYSINGGTSWIQLGANGYPDWYGVSPQTTCCGWGNGTLDSWTNVYYALCNLAGEPCVKFRLFANDLRETEFAFDNFEIVDRVDVGVTAFVEPTDDACLYTDQEQITVTITNFSCVDVDSVPVSCEVTGASPGSFMGMYTGTIAAGASVNYTFAGTLDMLPLGDYTFTGFTHYPSDAKLDNDTTILNINVGGIKVVNYPYFENFDVDTAHWWGGPINSTNVTKYWDWGVVPYLGGPQGNGNSFFLTDVNAGSVDAWVYSPLFDFTAATNPTMEFDIMMNSLNDSYDRYVVVQYQLNATGAWTQLGANIEPGWYGVSPQTTCCGWGNGTISPWQHVILEDICALSGEHCVRFRFWANDSYETQFAFDNFLVTTEDDDIEVVAITPADGGPCGTYSNAEQVGVLVRNNTCRRLTNIPVTFTMTGPNGASFVDTIPGPLEGQRAFQYIFPSTVDMSIAGTYTFTAEVFSNINGSGSDYINDTFPANNFHSEVRYSGTPINTYPYLADFNTTNDGWASLAPSTTIDEKYFYWDTIPYLNGSEGEDKSWLINFGNLGSRDCWVESPVFDLTTIPNPVLSMDIKIRSINDSYDRYAVVQYSLNGGTNWTQLGPSGYPDWYSPSPQTNCCGWGNGLLDSWTNVYYRLCQLQTETCVKFRVYANDLYETEFAFDNFQIFDRADFDVGVTVLNNPTFAACTYSSDQDITVTVENFSCTPATDVPITCVVTGPNSITITDTIAGTVPVGGALTHTFSSQLNMLPVGTYNFQIFVHSSTDSNQDNDTLYTSVDVNDIKVSTYPYSEDFNAAPTYWSGGPTNSSNVSKYFDLGPVPYLGGPQGRGDSWYLTDVNVNSVDAWVYSPIFDFTTATYPRLSMEIMLNSLADSYDRYAVIQYRLNETSGWTQLGANTDAHWYGDMPQLTCCGWGNGTLTNWYYVYYDLCNLIGEDCVRFRVWGNDLYETQFAFDNFRITDTPLDAELQGVYCCYGSEYHLDVTVFNNSSICNPTANITSLDITYELNGGAPVTQTITGLNIAVGTSGIVEVPGITVPDNASNLKVWCSLPNGIVDQVFENDTMYVNSTNWPDCNDHCSNALQLGLGTTTASQTSNATANPTVDPSFSGCGNPTLENTVWYYFTTASTGGDVTVYFENTTCSPSTNGIQVSIDQLTGTTCDPGGYTNVFCDNPGNTDTIQWDGLALDPNTTYYITVDGFAGNNCDFDIRIEGAVEVLLEFSPLSFSGKNIGAENVLNWTAEKEESLSKFILEHSADGVHFEKLATVAAIGNSSIPQYYEQLDPSPFDGWNYYRLKQIATNGLYEYTETVALYVDKGDNRISIHPNPTEDFFVFDYYTPELGNNLSVELYNAQGKRIWTKTYEVSQQQISHKINTEELTSGMYMVKFISGTVGKTKKLIIKR
ncbi:MAG: T9SS type A sorting domain-containing protein [Aureispira sp.]|nr:T9SS type A sorting domain-containing protein [Aureispira sp.]